MSCVQDVTPCSCSSSICALAASRPSGLSAQASAQATRVPLVPACVCRPFPQRCPQAHAGCAQRTSRTARHTAAAPLKPEPKVSCRMRSPRRTPAWRAAAPLRQLHVARAQPHSMSNACFFTLYARSGLLVALQIASHAKHLLEGCKAAQAELRHEQVHDAPAHVLRRRVHVLAEQQERKNWRCTVFTSTSLHAKQTRLLHDTLHTLAESSQAGAPSSGASRRPGGRTWLSRCART
jgi:hypothetical protein